MNRCAVNIKGTRQGQFAGELQIRGREAWSAALRFAMQVNAPRDPATGMATGRRRYQPIRITKEWGAASPQILTAMATNEVLNPIVMEFTRTNPNGEEAVSQRITLTNAVVSDISRSHEAGTAGAGTDVVELEEISFVFEKITVEDVMGGKTFSDNWSDGQG